VQRQRHEPRQNAWIKKIALNFVGHG